MSQELVSYDPKRGLGPVDRAILRGAAAHKSMAEISDIVNGILTPQEAGARILEILDSRDWLSQAQERMLLVDDMMNVKDKLTRDYIDKNMRDEVKPLISILTLLEKTLSAEKFDIEKAIKEISRAQSQLMLAAISLALERTLFELEKRYPDIPRGEVMEIFEMSMPAAVLEIEGHVPAS
jgi:hypothetical protein